MTNTNDNAPKKRGRPKKKTEEELIKDGAPIRFELATTYDDIYDELDKAVEGNKDLKEVLSLVGSSYAGLIDIHNSDGFDLAGTSPKSMSKPPVVLISGKSGSGKTFSVETLGQALKCPVEIIDCSNLTPAGYKGNTLDDAIKGGSGEYDLVTRVFKKFIDLWKVKRVYARVVPYILYLDEVDKLLGSSADHSTWMKATQFSLLKLLEGEGLRDEGNLPLIILSGSFANHEDKTSPANTSIGFGNKIDKDEAKKELLRDDLLNAGLIPELVGRMDIITSTEPVSKKALKNYILKNENSPLKRVEIMYCLQNKEMAYGEAEAIIVKNLDSLIDDCLKSKTGFRALFGQCFNLIRKHLVMADKD